LEKLASVDQKRAEVQAFLAEHATLLSRQASVQASWRRYRGRRLGPYYRLSSREGEKQCSLYLGRCPKMAEEVREALGALQGPLRHERELNREVRQIQTAIREEKQALDRDLLPRGLYRKGNEIRGWRALRRSSQAPTGPRETAPEASPGSQQTSM
jgi:hypothetical protein